MAQGGTQSSPTGHCKSVIWKRKTAATQHIALLACGVIRARYQEQPRLGIGRIWPRFIINLGQALSANRRSSLPGSNTLSRHVVGDGYYTTHAHFPRHTAGPRISGPAWPMPAAWFTGYGVEIMYVRIIDSMRRVCYVVARLCSIHREKRKNHPTMAS